jgi:ankyrin repeat protein
MENNIECLNLLIKHNDINLNMRNFDALFIVDHQTPIYLIGGQTCLHFACEYGHIECVSLLLSYMSRILSNSS